VDKTGPGSHMREKYYKQKESLPYCVEIGHIRTIQNRLSSTRLTSVISNKSG